MIRKVCFFGQQKKRFMQIESVLQTKNRSEPEKNRFSVALFPGYLMNRLADFNQIFMHITLGHDVELIMF